MAAVTGVVGVAQRMKTNHKKTAPERTVWVGGIPDWMAKSVDASNDGLEAVLCEVMSKFGTVEMVKPRFKRPGAEGTRREEWMGQSWGLVTFVTQAGADKAMEEGVKVSTLAPGAASGKVTLNLPLLVMSRSHAIVHRWSLVGVRLVCCSDKTRMRLVSNVPFRYCV